MSSALQVYAAEQDTLIFPQFTATDAWILGSRIRELSLQYPQPVAIRISLPSGQIVFTCFTRPGSVPDSETWLARKAATVFRWGASTIHMGEKLRSSGLPGDLLSEKFPVDDEKYACHGGGFPIKVKGVDGVVAAVVVSGLAQEVDHALAIEAIQWYLEELKK